MPPIEIVTSLQNLTFELLVQSLSLIILFIITHRDDPPYLTRTLRLQQDLMNEFTENEIQCFPYLNQIKTASVDRNFTK